MRYKVGGQLLRAIQSFYSESQACVWVNGNSQDGSSFLKVFDKGVSHHGYLTYTVCRWNN